MQLQYSPKVSRQIFPSEETSMVYHHVMHFVPCLHDNIGAGKFGRIGPKKSSGQSPWFASFSYCVDQYTRNFIMYRIIVLTQDCRMATTY